MCYFSKSEVRSFIGEFAIYPLGQVRVFTDLSQTPLRWRNSCPGRGTAGCKPGDHGTHGAEMVEALSGIRMLGMILLLEATNPEGAYLDTRTAGVTTERKGLCCLTVCMISSNEPSLSGILSNGITHIPNDRKSRSKPVLLRPHHIGNQ